jgi:hypothetical protein
LKKALVLAIVMVLGLGIGAFAAGPLSGDWSATVSLDLDETTLAKFISFSSSLGVDYTVCGWTFESSSGFSNDGYDSQSFAADGILGAFTFSTTMNFLPMAVLEKTTTETYSGNCIYTAASSPYRLIPDPVQLPPCSITTKTEPTDTAAAFDDWTVEGKVSIAGIDIAGLFFMENWAGTTTKVTKPVFVFSGSTVVQSGSYTATTPASTVTGAGWRFKLGGSFGDCSLTSYTYFNLTEGFSRTSSAMSFARDGAFEIVFPDQVVRFSEEYIVLEGLSLGCLEMDAALRITCADGFDYFSLWFKNIYLMCCGISTDFVIDFHVADKLVELFPTIETDWTCIEPTIELDLSADKTQIQGIKLTALSAEIVLNGVTFSSTTLFDPASYTRISSPKKVNYFFLIPSLGWNFNVGNAGISPFAGTVTIGGKPVVNAWLIPSAAPIPTPVVDTDHLGIYEIQKVSFAEEYIDTFEDFTITVDGDACCGGAFEFSLQTWFGWRYSQSLAEWGYWYETNADAAGAVTANMDHGQGVYFDNAGVAGTAGTAYLYDDAAGWYPRSGGLMPPVFTADIAYETLLGTSNTPVTYPTTAVVESIVSKFTLSSAAAATNGLFSWAKSAVSGSIGIGSNFTLDLGMAITYYGWDSFDLGFGFTF